jgi:mono/diheme cytochrome c family protein
MRSPLIVGPLLLLACGSSVSVTPDAAVTDVPRAVDTPATDAPRPVADAPASTAPTWAEHIAPILYGQCVSCHRQGGIGPFPLLTYAQATEMGVDIARVTRARTMPPTVVNATGSCNEYRDDVRRLTDAQIDTIQRWVAAGTPEGDRARAPQPPPTPTGLANADIRVDMGVTYNPNAAVQDDYRCFLVDPGNAEDRYITGYEVVPGDQRVVHHMILYALPNESAQRAAEALDARDTTPGYQCFGGPGVDNSPPLALWAPGGGATLFPARTGLRLAGGRKVVMQVHYNMANGVFPDRTVVNLQTQPSVSIQGMLFPIVDASLRLQPRMSEAVTSRNFPLSNLGGLQRIYIHGVAPHMHTLGRSLRVQTTDANGENRCVVDVPRWDFHWQGLYFYREPMVVELGEIANITCRYDTTSRNEVTTWGEGTSDEMCLTYFYATAASGR